MLELAIVVLIATFLGIVAKFLKQPLILGFILAGTLITYFGFFNLNNQEILRTLSDLGIMFLLFLVGLEIDFKSLKLIGGASSLIGVFQIILTAGFGFLSAYFLHFTIIESIYIGAALSFSSTIIVIKLLSEKKDTNSLYGKITTGILLFQDLVAVLILVFLSGLATGGKIAILPIIFTVLKAIILFTLIIFIGRKLLPYVFNKIVNHSQDLIFFSSLAWCFLVAAIVSHPKVGFPIEISGLLAGLALSNSSTHFQIFSKIKYLRDFFVLIFFVILGSTLVFSDFNKIIVPVAVLTAFVIIIKPLIIMIIMGISGYRKKTGFLTGITTAQLSEFSLVLAAIGLKLGHINDEIVSIITAVGIISIAISVYLFMYADGIFIKMQSLLSIFQRKKLKEEIYSDHNPSKPIILIGSHRLGESIAFNLKKEDLLIIDFDPDVVHATKKAGYDYLFGDINDDEIFEKAHFENAKLIISTVPDIKDSLYLLQKLSSLKNKGSEVRIIMRAENEEEVETLYKLGADYVIFPHFTSGQYIGKTIAIDPETKILDELRAKDLKTLRKIEHQQ